MTSTILIIQARTGSSRLPNKILKPLGQTTVLDYVVARSQHIAAVDKVIVATSTQSGDDLVEKWCNLRDVACFRGSELDVLSRYYDCASHYQPDYVVRVTADTPFLDMALAHDSITALKRSGKDFLKAEGPAPRGIRIEALSFKALEYLFHNANQDYQREHVTLFGYEFPDPHSWEVFPTPHELHHPQLRITVDTQEDYDMCCHIANYFNGDQLVPTCDVIDYLLTHPEVAKINAHIEQKPVKSD